MRSNERGEGRLGCLVVVLLLTCVIYVGFKVTPLYLDKLEFEDDLSRLAGRAGSENWNQQRVQEQLVRIARSRGFEAAYDDISVVRTTDLSGVPGIRIEVRIRRNVDFAGFEHTFQFSSHASTFIGGF